jgi:hypothetical protein
MDILPEPQHDFQILHTLKMCYSLHMGRHKAALQLSLYIKNVTPL